MNQNNIFEIEIPLIKTESNDLQRTVEWFEDRKGLFTGSEIDKLMSVERTASKYEWGRPEKLLSFGEAAKKYIFKKCKERQRNKVVKTPCTTSMNWGTNNESVVFDLLKEKYTKLIFSKESFLKVNRLETILGASPDGKAINKETGEVIGLEIKCATSWDGVYERVEETFDEKSKDFWQIQTEMLALNCDSLMYVTAEPPEDIFNGTIDDINEIIVHSSKVHQNAIIYRALIANEIVKEWLKHDGKVTINTLIGRVCSSFDYDREWRLLLSNKPLAELANNTIKPQTNNDFLL